jgi:hypothetical protein
MCLSKRKAVEYQASRLMSSVRSGPLRYVTDDSVGRCIAIPPRCSRRPLASPMESIADRRAALAVANVSPR